MNYLQNIGLVETLILAIFSITFLIQLYFYLYFYLRITFYKNKPSQNKEKQAISVIICARNEATNLENFLPGVLEQNYPNFEVIVVNDGSTDDTEDVLKRLKSQYNKLYVTTIPTSGKFKNGKKLALSIGLKAAKNDWIVLTDADCAVASPQWLEKMQEKFDDKTDFVLGYGAYMTQKGFLNRMIRFDTLFIALQYFTFAMAKIPYMGVGRNLAYRKEIFFANKGFTRHLQLESGDDDLFVNENANKINTAIVISPDAFTHSKPNTNFKKWFYQKKRHLTTSPLYKRKHKILLGLEIFSRILFYSSFIAGLFFYPLTYVIAGAFLIRLLLQLGILKSASVKFNEKGIFYLGILFDLLLPIINFMVHLSNLKIRKRKK